MVLEHERQTRQLAQKQVGKNQSLSAQSYCQLNDEVQEEQQLRSKKIKHEGDALLDQPERCTPAQQ